MTDIPTTTANADPGKKLPQQPLLGSAFRDKHRSGFEAAKRLIFLAILVLAMLIPLAMVESVVQERAERKQDVATEIGNQWGAAQLIGGPVLVIPYNVMESTLRADGSSENRLVPHVASFLPEQATMSANTAVEKRHKSIYEILVYGADLKLSGKFATPDFSKWNVDPSQVNWKEASIALILPGTQSMRSLKVMIDNEPRTADAGMLSPYAAGHGLHVDLPLTGAQDISYDIDLSLNGHDTFSVLPLAGQSTIEITSDWPHPNFIGNPLPVSHDISDRGFAGRWSVNHLASGTPMSWRDTDFQLDPSKLTAVGVSLTEPGDTHQQTDRIVKYGILVVGLTFGTIFIIGLLKTQRVHLVQYLLIGTSIALFYLLLLSLAEQMAFGWAYLIASIVDIAIVAWYASTTIRRLVGGLTGLLLAGIHFYLYVLLQMESYALLAGTIGLLIILLLVMVTTRKIDWYAVGEEPNRQTA